MWELMPYQKGEGREFIKHIQSGVDIAREDPAALLIFSGGQTRYPQALSEGKEAHASISDAPWFPYAPTISATRFLIFHMSIFPGHLY